MIRQTSGNNNKNHTQGDLAEIGDTYQPSKQLTYPKARWDMLILVFSP